MEIFLDNGEDQICSETVLPDEAPQYQATFELMATAPDMAKQIAGMRYQYAVCIGTPSDTPREYIDHEDIGFTRHEDNAMWTPNLADAQEIASEFGSAFLLRRLVTEPEVIE